MTIEEYKERISKQYKSANYDIDKYDKEKTVNFLWVWDEEPKRLEGIIKVVDYDGGGICSNITPSFDIECNGTLYKHVSIVDVELADPFYSETNMERLRRNAVEMNKTGGTIHNVE